MPALDPALQLMEAVNADLREEVRALLDRGLSVETRLSDNQTALTLALSKSHWSLAEDLLERGADPNRRVNASFTCLSWAGHCLQPNLVEKMLPRLTDLQQSDVNGYTPLAWAVRFGLVAAVERLIEAGARLDSKDFAGNSLLHLAAQQPNAAIVTKLLAASPGLARSLNKYLQQNPLHLASQAQSTSTDVIEALLAGGVAPDLKDHYGYTPIVLAASCNSEPVLNALLGGRQISQDELALALKLAIAADRGEQVARLMARYDMSSPLDELHPLRAAIAVKRWPIVAMLLRFGFDPDSRLPDGEALLSWSMRMFLPELARALLEAGATIGREQATDWLDNVMLMRKVGKVRLLPGSRSDDDPFEGHLLLALQKNIESLGFVLSPELAERVLTLSLDELRAFYERLVPCLRAMVGADKAYKPMYPNYPDQVRKMSEAELYLNAALHYWGDMIGRRIIPRYLKELRPALQEKPALKPVGLALPEEASQLFRRLLEGRGSLTPADREILGWFVFSRGDHVADSLPEEVPFRENAALLAAYLLRFTSLHPQARRYLKSGLDVLRTAAAYSGGDVSLSANTRFVRFSKSLRRWFLAGLEADPDLDESLWRQPEKFKRLGERLHPGEFARRFPKTWEAFRRLRSGAKPATFGSQVESHLLRKDVEALLSLLSTRPGELARRLDHLLRLSSPEQRETVLASFARVIASLPSPLLLQLRNHFQSRHIETRLRVVFPKGDVGKLKAVDTVLPPLQRAICERIEALCRQALIANYAQRPPLGPCWLDERLKRYKVPFALRSAAKSLRTVARGSRIPFSVEREEAGGPRETMRFFIWWRDGKSRTDLDLSAMVLDEDFGFQTTLAYYNLKELGGYHSGDITSAPQGASEFIDIEIPTFVGRGSRYVMMVVNSYTTQPYCDLPECFAGFMRRNQPQSGEIYEPRTVLNTFDLSANSTIAIPLILDLRLREVIWTDLSLKRNLSADNNVHANRSSLSVLCQAMVNLNKPSLHDLFELHIEARGSDAARREDAQTVFLSEPAPGALTPYDIPRIMAEYL